MRRSILGVIAAAALLAIVIPVAIAQSRRQPPGLQQAARALLQGRYDEVASLTATLDQQDPVVAGIKAKALIARGQYSEAEALLKPIAQKAPTSEAALELGVLYDMLGRPEAGPLLNRIATLAETADDAQELSRAARAYRALDRPHDANAAYRDALRLAPKDAAINSAWGDLFLEKHQKDEALKSYQAALQADAEWQPALLGSARAIADENPPQAAQLASKALTMNPSDVGAHVFLAELAIDNDKRDEARAMLQKALAINPQSLEAHSLVAGLAYVEDKRPEFEATVANVLAIAPTYGEVYRVAGELTAHAYRFDEAVELVQRGLKLHPNDTRSLADLGTHLLRTGDEPGARRALEVAWEGDKFNLITLNLLRMMDTLDKFVTVEDGNIILRMDKDEAPVMQESVLAVAHEALATFEKRYQFKVRGPILIEIFPKHDDFAVRNVGLPGMIGALGACFGRVVTLDSPKARPPGEFQWEATLWHELAHVVTLQMSEQRIPRLFSEGISEYEEKIARPEWRRNMDMAFASGLNNKEVPKLNDLNAAFQNPRMISLAYYQGSLLIDHLVTLYGDAGLQKLVRAFAKGLDTEAALKQELNTDYDKLQASFDEAMEKRYGDLRKALAVDKDVDLSKMPLDALKKYAAERQGSYPVQFVLGNAARKAGEIDVAIQAFERAAAAAPTATGDESPRALLADIALEKGDTARAIQELKQLVAVDYDNVGAARELARLLRQTNVTDAATLYPVYRQIVAVDPYDAEAHAIVGELALKRNEPQVAIRSFRTVLALKPVDQAAALTNLADAYFRGGQRPEARKQILAALEIAPGYERAQDLLLKISEGR
jgi:tetratricopeptide (TPR) repeat protein